MPINPSNPALINPLPMFDRGAASSAPLYNAIAQKAVDWAEAVRFRRVALESQVTSLESRLNAASPQFTTLLANANTLNSQVNTSIAANNSSDTALNGIQDNLTVNNQNADIQLSRISPITALIDSLTIGQEIQGYSDLLNRIAAASRLASRILGTDASGNVLWRSAGSVGSGVLLRAALLVRRLTDTGAGGAAPALQNWNSIDLSLGLNTLGASYNAGTKQVTVPGGEYMIFGFSTGSTNGLQCRLRNASNNTVIALGNSAKGTITTAVSATTEPLNFLTRIQGAALVNSTSQLEFQSWYDGSANTAVNTQGASAAITAYTPQQSAIVLLRVVY